MWKLRGKAQSCTLGSGQSMFQWDSDLAIIVSMFHDFNWCYNMQPSNYRTIISPHLFHTHQTPPAPRSYMHCCRAWAPVKHKSCIAKVVPVMLNSWSWTVPHYPVSYSVLDLTRHINEKTSMLADCALFTLYGDIFRHQLSPHQWQLSLVKHTDFQRTQRTQESCAQNSEPMRARPFDTPQFGLCFAR